MRVPRPLVRNLVFPLHERLRGRRTPRLLAEMRRNDRLSKEELHALHEHRLVEHLKRAAERVPYYRDRVDAAAIRAAGDLARFPLLDKPMVREAMNALRTEGFAGRVFPLETGGSSGEPLRFLSDQVREASQLACKWRARAWWGLDPGHRETDLWGSPIEAARGGANRLLAARLLGHQLLSAFDLSDATMAGFRRRIEGGAADFVYGYASVLARYGRWLLARGEDLAGAGLRVAVTTAEMLFPADREVIARAFGCPVANEYGCRDGGLIAHECPGGALHLMHDAVHVEVLAAGLDAAAPGDSGEVVVTNLFARGFPMIRYRLGDRMAMSSHPCPCGLPHPVVAALEGRITDTVVRDDGSRVHGLALIYILRELSGVTRFQCVQDRVGSVRVAIVPGAAFDAETLGPGVVERVRRVLGAGTSVEVSLVDDLPPLPSGKHRYVICTV